MKKYAIVLVSMVVLASIGMASGDVVVDGLVLSMDASQAGGDLDQVWSPVLAPNMSGGDLLAYGPFGKLPYFGIDTVTDVGDNVLGYNWFYSFDPNDRYNSSHVIDLDADESLNFDYDEDFTIEVWFRTDTPSKGSADRGTIFGNQSPDILQGYRLGVRGSGTNYYPEFTIRDTAGAELGQFHIGGPLIPYADNSWQNLVLVYNGGVTGADMDMYLNGVHRKYQRRDLTWTETDFVPTGNTATIGGITSVWPFDGDVSIVRVYNRNLTLEEIQTNHSVGMLSNINMQCLGQIGDIDGDCDVDFDDFVLLASHWLESNFLIITN